MTELIDLVKCVVCQETSRPEVKFGGCCGTILGCGSCLEHWTGNKRMQTDV